VPWVREARRTRSGCILAVLLVCINMVWWLACVWIPFDAMVAGLGESGGRGEFLLGLMLVFCLGKSRG
jgi:hypothetical protein